MLDIQFIRAHPDLVRAGAVKKRIPIDLDRLLDVDRQRRLLAREGDDLRALSNAKSKAIPALQGPDKQAAIEALRRVSDQIKELEARTREVDAEFLRLMYTIPNVPAAEVPDGEDEKDNVEIRRWGAPRAFAFKPKDHLELGESLDIVDVPRGAKLAGARNYFLKGAAVLLEMAVLRLALDHLLGKGFVPLQVPLLVRDPAMIGTAYFPGGEEQAYRIEKDGLNLIGTAEVSVTAYHGDEILGAEELPRRYVALSPCFRREAGAAGKDTRGLYRVHQFYKVEQVVLCEADPELSKREHLAILRNSEEILEMLALPYRVVNVCGGDLGVPQIQKFDLETWMPSRDAFGETHSASRFHDFQARRLNLRYRTATGAVRHCHTMNNTVIASPRILVAILENYQNEDGSVTVPRVLRAYMGGMEAIRAR
ncbi:MAG TPA: serine--tRNA ligase [Methylomirabilota bacterium]|jgi:seryl-tRNA synthetase|nr:serine--tRNA ligase [Methylomirabilota bacterium]